MKKTKLSFESHHVKGHHDDNDDINDIDPTAHINIKMDRVTALLIRLLHDAWIPLHLYKNKWYINFYTYTIHAYGIVL